jgi:hypothetical protein
LLLATGAVLALGVSGWAEGQTTGTTAQPTQKDQGLTIDYWEPQVGTTNIYYINDWMNDAHGDYYDTSTLGYWDVTGDTAKLYPNYPPPGQLLSSHYYTVEATSSINPVYFDLKGPWYLWMTTPFKIREEIIGIHEAPDAAEFPQATYAVRDLVICSGGHRYISTSYMSNDAGAKTWLMWGEVDEFIIPGDEQVTKYVAKVVSPADKKTPSPYVVMRFPMSVGTSSNIESVYIPGLGMTDTGTLNVVAEGKVTVPAGTFDALLVQRTVNLSQSGVNAKRIEYLWMVKDIGPVAMAKSLPNVIGPTFDEATGYYSRRYVDKVWYNSEGLVVMESTTVTGGEKSK